MKSNFISFVFWDNRVWERYPVLYMSQCLFTLVGRNTNYFQPCVYCKKVLAYYFLASFFSPLPLFQPYGVPFHAYASLQSDAYLWDLLHISGLSISLSAATSSLLSCRTISSCLSFCEHQFLYPQFNELVVFYLDWPFLYSGLENASDCAEAVLAKSHAYFVSILSGITAMCFLCPISKNCSFIYFVFYDKRKILVVVN